MKNEDDLENKVGGNDGDGDGTPKFGRLLLCLLGAVMLIIMITIGTEAYYSG